MPIYDFDGSTSREIGKLYDNNGTTSSQIKEVYDNDGTTSRLVYKDAPDYLFNWGDNAEITGGWSVKKWVLSGSANGIIGADYLDLYIGNTGNSNRRIYIHTNKAVNVTDLKSISMTYGGTSTVTCPDHNAAWWGSILDLPSRRSSRVILKTNFQTLLRIRITQNGGIALQMWAVQVRSHGARLQTP